MFLLQLFGGVALLDENGPVVGPAVQRRRLALLALLAASPTRGLSRDKLIGLFWPDEERERARHFLADSLFTLRRHLGKESILTVGDDLVLSAERVRADVADFHQALADGDREGAAALYRGPFLDGFFVSDAPEFERWVETERARLARLLADALEGLARESEGRGEHERAAHWWGRLATLDPLNSRVALRLMQSLAAAGDRARAIQHARVHGALLREELDAAPDPEVEALAAGLAAPPVPPPAASPAPPAAPAPVAGPAPAPGAAPEPPAAAPEAPLRGEPAPVPPPRKRAWRGGRRLALGAAALLLLALALVPTAGWLRRTVEGDPEPGERTTIAVFPFTVYGDADYLAEGMAELLARDLDGVGDLRTTDPFVLLGRAAELGPPGSHTLATAARLSRSLDADAFLLGRVVVAGEQLRVAASLYDADDPDAPPVTVEASGAFPNVAVDLARQLLAGRTGSDRLSRIAVRTGSIPALRAYFEGDRHFRAARYETAADSFRRAVQEDPGFALAHYRLSTSAEWSFSFTEARAAAESARRLSERLSPNDQQLILAWHAFVNGDPLTAERRYNAILAEDPSDVEARSGLGELRVHYNHVLGQPVREAKLAFEQTLRLAPNYGEARFHLLEFAAADGDSVALDSLLAGVDAGSEQRLSWEAARTLAWGTPAEARAMLRRLRGEEEVVVGIAAVRAGANFRDPPAAEAIAALLTTPDRPDGWRAAGHILVAQGALVRGQWDAARAQLEAARAIEPAWALEIGALGALLPGIDPPPPPAELRRLRDELQRWDPGAATPELAFFFAAHADAHAQLRLYLLAMLSARLGEEEAAARYVRELRGAGQTREGRELGASLVRSVEAERAARGGDRERALRLLEQDDFRAPLERIALSPFFARALDRWHRAELLLALGRPEEALTWYRSLTDGPDILFWAPAHRRQIELLTRLGRRDEAARQGVLLEAIRPVRR